MTTEDKSATEEKKERTIDQLIDLPYSEMTEDEIEKLVEYKAQVKANEQERQARIQAIHEAGAAMVEQNKAQFEEAKAAQDNLLNLSLQRLNNLLS